MASPTLHLNGLNPVQVEFAWGLLRTRHIGQPFFVLADPAAISLSFQAELQTHWGDNCLFWIWQRASQSSITAALTLCQQLWPLWQKHPDAALLAIGGGTTLDLAKVARFRLRDLNTAPDVWRAKPGPVLEEIGQRHPLWCAPTTAGTGSEVTVSATLWDLEASPSVKRTWAPPNGHADQAFVDPSLTLTCPWPVTRDTALDTLAHALESLWNVKANDQTRPLAIQAARSVLHYLPPLMHHLQDTDSRAALSQASLQAGLAMSHTQTALAHALSYDLTLHEKLPHGQACAVWLPMVMDMAARRSAQVRNDLAQIFDLTGDSASAQMSDWLLALDIRPRDVRETTAGQAQIQQALASLRGRNFIGNAP
jgi:alcohol dehydrogenase class IV